MLLTYDATGPIFFVLVDLDIKLDFGYGYRTGFSGHPLCEPN